MQTKMTRKYSWWSVVTISVFLGFAALAHAFMTRTLGLVLVDIVKPTSTNTSDVPTTAPPMKCNLVAPTPANNANKSNTNAEQGQFEWDLTAQANIIAIHDWIELGFLPFSGLLVSFWKPGIQMGIMSLLAAGATAALPALALHADYGGVMVSRGILGFCHAITSPATDAVVAREVPLSVRSTAYAVVTSGSQIAVFFGLPLTGYFIDQNIFGGWQANFYVSAIVCFVWAVIWLVFLSLFYKEHEALPSETVRKTRREFSLKHIRPLWRDVFRHQYIWAIFPCDIAATFIVRLLTYYIPMYYSDVFHLPLLDNALFSALPFISMMITKFLFAASADALKRKYGFNPNTVAKVYNTFAFVGSGICIFLTTLIPCLNKNSAVALITIGAGIYSASTPGFRLSYTSITKRWAGVVSASCSVIAMVAGILFPYFVAGVASTTSDKEKQWQIIFGVMLAFDILAAIIFHLFGSVMNMDKPLEASEINEDTAINSISKIPRGRQPNDPTIKTP